MGIPFYLQYYVEDDRSSKFQWLSYGIQLISYLLYGLIFHWIPKLIRSKRDENTNKFKPYWVFLRICDSLTQVFKLRIPYITTLYIQPSLLVVYGSYLAINGVFCVLQTKDLDYLPWDYVIAKRISRIAISNLPLIYILVIKNDLLTTITGLTHDKLVIIHKWISRTMFAMIAIHIGMASRYWLHLGFPIMLVIPPQIFGYIAFVSLFFLNFGSLKFIRRWAYDFFLVEHRIFSFIMLLFAFFHSMRTTKATVILAVHQLVIDRILSRILSFMHARMSPTKGKSVMEILDEDTILVTVPIKAFPFHERKWWQVPLPKFNTWKAGQHVYLTVGKVSLFQQHPFTIASLSESGEMKFVIRVQKGFTLKLKKKILKLQEEKENESDSNSSTSSTSQDSIISSSSNSINVETELLANNRPSRSSSTDDEEAEVFDPNDIVLKATFVGPVGAKYLPLITFDSVLFFSAGSGASFTLPVCLDLLNEIVRRNSRQDFLNRCANPLIKLVLCFKNIDNVYWYSFLLGELQKYCNKGMLKIDIFVTQEQLMPLKSKMAVENTDNTVTYVTNEKEAEKVLDKELSSTDSNLEQSSDFFYTSNVNVHLGRPNIEGTIDSHVSYLKDEVAYKSLAVLSCGPEDFTYNIKKSSHKHRWDANAPDVYCYTESFG